jgi:hypothetical protein
MAVDKASGARAVLGSLHTEDGLLVRVTARCLHEDLGLDPRTPFAALLDGPIGTAFSNKRSTSTDGPSLSVPTVVLDQEDTRLLIHPQGDGQLLWVVACGRSDEDATELDARGELEPTFGDLRRLEGDLLTLRIRRLQVEAPLALAAAGRDRDLPVEIPALPPAATLRVARPEGVSVIVAIVLEPNVTPSTRLGRAVALMLAAVRANGRWRLVEDDAELARARAILGLEPGVLDVPVSLIFCDQEATG